MLQLSPTDLSLPAKFPQWRPGQWDAVYETVCSDKRFIAQNAPTGFGKSLYCQGVAALEGGRNITLTATKALQNQYLRDFDITDIRGRQNYPCLEFSNCSDGRLFGCSAGSGCSASYARQQFLSSSRSVTNYDYYLASMIHGDGMGSIDLLTMDEGHSAVQQLSDAIEIHLPATPFEVLYRHFSSYPQPSIWTLTQYRDWSRSLLPQATKYKESLKSSDRDYSKKLLGLVSRFCDILTQISRVPDDWILDNSSQKETIIAPLWPTDYAPQYLFPPQVKRVLLVSATIVPKTLSLLGITPDQYQFLSQPHTFDPRLSPVYLFGGHKVQWDNTPEQDQLLVGRVDMIVGKRLDRKAIIHSHSYDWAEKIDFMSDYGRRGMGIMITHKDAKGLSKALEDFDRATAPAILVSPSVTTGYDFPGSKCEYQIIMKMPFIDARGPVMAARVKSDPEYIPYLMSQTVVQECGRATRFPGDRCENFILDRHANWFVLDKERTRTKRGYRHLFPPWFIRQLVWPESFPVPPPPLPLRMAA